MDSSKSVENISEWHLFRLHNTYYVTEIDAGHETPDAARFLGFFHAIF